MMNVTSDGHVYDDDFATYRLPKSDYNQIETVEDQRWVDAAHDLHESMKHVPSIELQSLINALHEGKVNGSFGVIADGCGCFIAILASHLTDFPTRDSFTSFKLFRNVYENEYAINMMSPFQEWLCLVKPNDTPANHVIAKLFADELQSMINEHLVNNFMDSIALLQS